MKIKGLRWLIIGLVSLSMVINLIDRNALAVMWPGISKDLGMDKNQYAFVVSCFFLAYGISQIISGRIYDKVGTKMGFVLSIVVWSFAVVIHAAARGIMSFSIFRALLGLGEAGNMPGAVKSNAEWFPIKERAFAQGIFNVGSALGSIISAPLIAFFYIELGWKSTFIIIGIMGLLWLIPWWIVHKGLPTQHPWITDEEREYILKGQMSLDTNLSNTEDRALSIREVLQYRQSWSVILSRFFLDPIWWLFVSWLPLYLNERFGFDVKQIGMYAWMPYVGAMIGSLGGGWLTQLLINKGWSVNRTRRFAIGLGALVMFPALIASAFAATPIWAMATVFIALMGFQITIGNVQIMPSDFFSGKSVGTLAGLGGAGAALGVLITTWLVPTLTKDGYFLFFALATALVPLGVAMIYFLSGDIKRIR